jgi:hypothetical protein
MGITINVPRLNDELWDYAQMAMIWRQVMEAGDGVEVTFDFSSCDFLRPNAVVFLGGLARVVQSRGGNAWFLVNTMQSRVQMNLLQNGFAHVMGADVQPWQGNSIPYREYPEQAKDEIIHHLKTDWLGRNWINVSDALASAIAGQVWEIFANAFEHSHTPVGVNCCGQYFPRYRELTLAVGDFGVGIPNNVRGFLDLPGLTPAQAMEWAFTKGKSTAKNVSIPRGLGFDLLKEFVQRTRGRMEVFSHDGYTRIDAKQVSHHNLTPFFAGTLVQIRVLCDDTVYILANELQNEPIF